MSITVPEAPNLSHTLCVLLSGKAGVGKTRSADVMDRVANDMGLNVCRASFAHKVKEAGFYIGWDGVKDARGRALLQSIGKAGRAYDQDLWVRETFNTVSDTPYYPYDVVIIDDWRFNNEYFYIKNKEPLYKVRTVRIVAPARETLIGTPEYEDVSETALDDFTFDWTVYNNGEHDNYVVDTHLGSILKLCVAELTL